MSQARMSLSSRLKRAEDRFQWWIDWREKAKAADGNIILLAMRDLLVDLFIVLIIIPHNWLYALLEHKTDVQNDQHKPRSFPFSLLGVAMLVLIGLVIASQLGILMFGRSLSVMPVLGSIVPLLLWIYTVDKTRSWGWWVAALLITLPWLFLIGVLTSFPTSIIGPFLLVGFVAGASLYAVYRALNAYKDLLFLEKSPKTWGLIAVVTILAILTGVLSGVFLHEQITSAAVLVGEHFMHIWEFAKPFVGPEAVVGIVFLGVLAGGASFAGLWRVVSNVYDAYFGDDAKPQNDAAELNNGNAPNNGQGRMRQLLEKPRDPLLAKQGQKSDVERIANMREQEARGRRASSSRVDNDAVQDAGKRGTGLGGAASARGGNG